MYSRQKINSSCRQSAVNGNSTAEAISALQPAGTKLVTHTCQPSVLLGRWSRDTSPVQAAATDQVKLGSIASHTSSSLRAQVRRSPSPWFGRRRTTDPISIPSSCDDLTACCNSPSHGPFGADVLWTIWPVLVQQLCSDHAVALQKHPTVLCPLSDAGWWHINHTWVRCVFSQ